MKKIIIILMLLCIGILLLADSSKKNETFSSEGNYTITGNVKNRTNRAVRNVSIILKGTKSFSTKTDKKGDFVLKNIPSGDYEFTAKHSIYEIYKDSFSLSDSNYSLTVVLEPIISNGKVKGTVKDENGKSIAYASVTISGTSLGAQTDNAGNYLIEEVPSGTYDVICQMMGFSPIRKKNVTIKESKQSTLNFTLEKTEVDLETFMAIEKRETSKTDSKDKKHLDSPPLIEGSGKKTEPLLEDRTSDETAEYLDIPAVSATKTTSGSSTSSTSTSYKPTQSGLRAGYSDDNKQFNYYLHFLERFKNKARHLPIYVEDRFNISCLDSKGKSIPNLEIRIYNKDDLLIETGKTMANGTFLFFPAVEISEFFIDANYKGNSKKIHYSKDESRKIEIRFEQTEKKIPQPTPLDILFIMDTTGSMGEEIQRLKQMIELIALNIETFSPKPEIRLGMVLYKDKDDEYVTKTVPFTSDIAAFQKELNKVDATGGGDFPEDLHSALFEALNVVEWNEDGIRLAFIITDAPPHLDYDQEYTYKNAIEEAKENAIKLYSVGTGGLDVNGEYVLRQISQYTSAAYVFLTYGETGESAGGKPGSVSHHTGDNFQTDKLESIIIHFVREELKAFHDQEIETADEYFVANKIEDEKPKETLEILFHKAFQQLVDYSSVKLNPEIATSIAPIISKSDNQKANAEYFYDNMLIALSQNETFLATERKDLQPILDELKFQLDALADEENAAELGKFLGAKLLIVPTLYEKDDCYEMIIKLMKIETVEILSITKVRVDKRLGL